LTRINPVVEVQPEYYTENALRNHTMREGVDSHAVMTCADLILQPSNSLVHSRNWFHPILKAETLILITIREPHKHKCRVASNAGAM
jgi:hypothetical protein